MRIFYSVYACVCANTRTVYTINVIHKHFIPYNILSKTYNNIFRIILVPVKYYNKFVFLIGRNKKNHFIYPEVCIVCTLNLRCATIWELQILCEATARHSPTYIYTLFHERKAPFRPCRLSYKPSRGRQFDKRTRSLPIYYE